MAQDTQKNDSTTTEKLADSAVKNPMKTLFWILLIAISTLTTVIGYIYKDDASTKEKALTTCYSDKNTLIDSMCTMQAKHNEELKEIYSQNIKELNKRIDKQEVINQKNSVILYTTKKAYDSVKNSNY